MFAVNPDGFLAAGSVNLRQLPVWFPYRDDFSIAAGFAANRRRPMETMNSNQTFRYEIEIALPDVGCNVYLVRECVDRREAISRGRLYAKFAGLKPAAIRARQVDADSPEARSE
jgi:hypothetical protein